jgi:hypothetical protein
MINTLIILVQKEAEKNKWNEKKTIYVQFSFYNFCIPKKKSFYHFQNKEKPIYRINSYLFKRIFIGVEYGSQEVDQ